MNGFIVNKRGTTTVFLCMILSVTLLLIGFFGEASAGLLARPYCNSILDLAGRSILSEYDRTLKNQYGIFGFLLDEENIESKLVEYTNKSLEKSKGKISLLPLKIEEVDIDLSEFTLSEINKFEEQILDHMKLQIVAESLNITELINNEKRPWGRRFTGLNEEKDEEEPTKRMRTLRNGKVVNSLPSRLLKGCSDEMPGILDLPIPQRLGKIAYNELCINSYIMKYFRNDLNRDPLDNTFFSNEIEYIISGRFSDEANRNIVYLSLLSFRTAINTTHIYTDETKRNAVIAAAAVVSGGAGTVAAQAAITAIWAGAEAAIDMDRLGKGGKVPLIKTSEDWVLTLENALEGTITSMTDLSDEPKGLSYEDYLFLLLCFKSRESKVIRIMDLIQLNIKGFTNEDFEISKCRTGFRYDIKMARKKGFPGLFSLRTGRFTGAHIY